MVRAKGRPQQFQRGFALPGLRRTRQNAGLTLRELEELTAENRKVWRQTISEIERGEHGAYPSTAKRLADALGVSVEDLRHGGE